MNFCKLTKYFFTFQMIFFFTGLLFAQTSRPIASDINASATSTTTITVSWVLPEKTEGEQIVSLAVYRNTRPITGNNALSISQKIATLPYNSVSYTDTLNDYREYYYAVISYTKPGDYERNSDLYYDEELDKNNNTGGGTPYEILLPGVNSTVNGVRVKSPVKANSISKKTTESAKEKIYSAGDLREQPLPYLDILGDSTTPDPKISKDTESKALSLVGGKQTHSIAIPLEPYYFEQDMMSPEGGDDFLLYEVLRTTFVAKNYPAATASLLRFLAQNRTQDVTNRAVFYLGESYYYCGKYEKALNQFLTIEDTFTSLSRKWIESTLELYKVPASENNITE